MLQGTPEKPEIRDVVKMMRTVKIHNNSKDIMEHRVDWITKSFSPLIEHRLLLQDVSFKEILSSLS